MEPLIAPNLSPEEVNEKFQILQYKVKELEIEKLWRKFEGAGFEPILIKGWAASKLYPQPFQRQFTDVDLVISPERYQEALKFSKDVRERVPVDLHKGLRHLDDLDFKELFVNSVTEKCCEIEVRLLRPEDHLRVLCVHWLTDGGAYKERLWDIYYAVSNRSEDFDWDRLLNVTSLRRRRWIVCTIGLANRFLGLDLKGTPISEEALSLPAWLVKTVEREWASEVKMLPLEMFLNDKKMLWKQIKKRIPPNPIHATVMEEGDFDANLRIHYQIKNFFSRMKPSLKRNRVKLFSGRKKI